GLAVTVVVALGRLVPVVAAEALAVSARHSSESPSKSSIGRTLRHFWHRRQFAAISSRLSSCRRPHPTKADGTPRFGLGSGTPPPSATRAGAGQERAQYSLGLSTRRGRRRRGRRPASSTPSTADR